VICTTEYTHYLTRPSAYLTVFETFAISNYKYDLKPNIVFSLDIREQFGT